jgi:hypothetical protein
VRRFSDIQVHLDVPRASWGVPSVIRRDAISRAVRALHRLLTPVAA